MIPRYLFGFGPSNHGFELLRDLLASKQGITLSLSLRPVLAWDCSERSRVMRERLRRLEEASGSSEIVGDIATSYLPYIETILHLKPDSKFIYLQASSAAIRNKLREECVDSRRLKLNHWSIRPTAGWYHDPIHSRAFPKYPISEVEDGIDRYITEYESSAERLILNYPDRILSLDPDELKEPGRMQMVAEWLSAELPSFEQQDAPNFHAKQVEDSTNNHQTPVLDALDGWPKRCAILVPFNNFIHQDCESGLKELERQGYEVRRVAGYSAIDQGRNQMATDALIDGFEETLWIDSDIGFAPSDVEKIRNHRLPITCGLYPKKGVRELACHIAPTTPSVVFGIAGGLAEVHYAGAGFLHIRREVYQTIQRDLGLKVCNELFGVAMIPFFQPLVREHGDGYWYLAEDYAFCERARQCGFKIYADTTIRLWHVGTHRYSWENAGIDFPRYDTFTLQIHGETSGSQAADPRQEDEEDTKK